jgi:hypothetical protein
MVKESRGKGVSEACFDFGKTVGPQPQEGVNEKLVLVGDYLARIKGRPEGTGRRRREAGKDISTLEIKVVKFSEISENLGRAFGVKPKHRIRMNSKSRNSG